MKVCFFGAYDRNFTSNQIVLKGLRLNGVHVTEVNAHIPVTKLNTKEDMTIFELIKRIFRKWRIVGEAYKHWDDLRACDWIYVGYPGHFDVLVAYPIAKLLRKKLVFNPLIVFYTGFVHEQGILSADSFLAKMLMAGERLMYRLCDLVITDTNLQTKHLHSLFGIPLAKMRTVAIGADNDIYKYSPKSQKDKQFVVVYYGLYAPIHGTEYIVEAAKLCHLYPKIQFLMVGKGNTYEKTVSQANDLKLTNVHFYPEMTETNAFETLSRANIFLGFLQKHPSVDRIVPNKVYQGLAMGKTVVSGDSPVMREVFTHKQDVYLCNQADGKSLAAAIQELYKNPKLTTKIAHNGYNTYRKQFTPVIIGRNILQALESVSP